MVYETAVGVRAKLASRRGPQSAASTPYADSSTWLLRRRHDQASVEKTKCSRADSCFPRQLNRVDEAGEYAIPEKRSRAVFGRFRKVFDRFVYACATRELGLPSA